MVWLCYNRKQVLLFDCGLKNRFSEVMGLTWALVRGVGFGES